MCRVERDDRDRPRENWERGNERKRKRHPPVKSSKERTKGDTRHYKASFEFPQPRFSIKLLRAICDRKKEAITSSLQRGIATVFVPSLGRRTITVVRNGENGTHEVSLRSSRLLLFHSRRCCRRRSSLFPHHQSLFSLFLSLSLRLTAF